MRAFCYRSGLIVFSGRKGVDGTLPIAEGPARQLRRATAELARRSYGGKLLVPGLPEARDWPERSAALMRFTAAVEKALGQRHPRAKDRAREHRQALRDRLSRTAS